MPWMLLVGLLLAADEPVLRVPWIPEPKLVRRVDPEYPVRAYDRRIEGAVRFQVVIGKDGAIERLRLLSGHPLLARAARDAVKQWIYEPVLLNGKPIRVVTQVAVRFRWAPRRGPPRVI